MRDQVRRGTYNFATYIFMHFNLTFITFKKIIDNVNKMLSIWCQKKFIIKLGKIPQAKPPVRADRLKTSKQKFGQD